MRLQSIHEKLQQAHAALLEEHDNLKQVRHTSKHMKSS